MKIALLFCGILISVLCLAQDKTSERLQAEKAKAIIDTEIASMIGQISADSIRSYIAKMVSFGTRHSLSDTISAQKGIGAARRWVAGKFRQFARDNKASMQVTLDPFLVTPNP